MHLTKVQTSKGRVTLHSSTCSLLPLLLWTSPVASTLWLHVVSLLMWPFLRHLLFVLYSTLCYLPAPRCQVLDPQGSIDVLGIPGSAHLPRPSRTAEEACGRAESACSRASDPHQRGQWFQAQDIRRLLMNKRCSQLKNLLSMGW